jgi:hypothetical protein
MPVIELKAPRILAIADRKRTYRLTVSRILKKQWLRYFENIVSATENQGGKRIDSYDSSAARLQLLDDCLVTAEGYALAAGVDKIESMPEWKSQLPLSHRLAAANMLLAVTPAESDEDEPIALGQGSVYLDALWTAAESGITKFHGLRHNFKTPTAEQQRRLSRDSSRSRIVGGSRGGKTLWLGAQATLADLYDELIVSVEGYTVDGQPPDRAEIVEFMDTYHKVAAVDVLFAPAAPRVEEDGD